VVFGVPLALLVARRPRAAGVVLGVAGVVQTIPGLALLALMVPLLGAFGFWPALSALTLYALLPILRNAVTGIRGVDEAVLEAADGMGMTARQRLLSIELPLALPVIVAGIRTAVVWTVGMATLSTPVGQPSLGSYIFAGLQTRNWTALLVGCAAAAVLAVVLDGFLALLDRSLTTRRRGGVALSLTGLVAIVLASGLAPLLTHGPSHATAALSPRLAPALAGQAPTRETRGQPSTGNERPLQPPAAPIHVGAKTFTEQYILASAIGQRLEGAGLEVERHESLGSNLVFDALRAGDIDVYVEYTGTIWASYMQRAAAESSWRTLALTGAWLAEHGVRLLGPLGFENAYCLAMRRERADALGVRSIADLAPRAQQLSLGSDYEFFDRAEWRRLAATYRLELGRTTSYDPSFMYAAVASGEVDLITAFSSDGRIDSLDLLVLADPERAFPPYDAVLLLSPRVAESTRVVEALRPLLGTIDVERMRRANQMVDRDADKRTPEQAAAWLLGAASATP
jgi:osmoprotectant transport system permease protein